MNVKDLVHAASRGVSRQIFTVKQNSPTLLLGAGVVGFVSTVVLACRATNQVSDILSQAETLVEIVDKDDNEEVAEKAKKTVKLQTAIKIAKAYALPVVVGTASIVALTSSHNILKNRNVGLTAAYATLDAMHKRYRANVIADAGPEKDQEYRFGLLEKEIVDAESGLVETAKGIDVEAVKKHEASDYARMFDKWNEHWEPSHKQNLWHLQSVIKQCEDIMRLRGWVLLNEVYDMLGFEPTEAGSQVGWRKDAHLDGTGNGYISFGLELNNENAKNFINGTRHDVLLDFNVDGVITGKFRKV